MASFCAIADLVAWLQIDIPQAKQAAATRCIREASAMIQNYCRQTLAAVANDAATLDGNGTTRLALPQLPVTAIVSVVEDGEALDSDEYTLGQHGLLHRVNRVWPRGVQNIVVTYNHGYATTPDDIAAVCARAAGRAYQAGLRADEMGGIPGVASTSLGDYAVAFGGESGGGQEGILGASAAMLLLPSEKQALARYRV